MIKRTANLDDWVSCHLLSYHNEGAGGVDSLKSTDVNPTKTAKRAAQKSHRQQRAVGLGGYYD